MKPLNTQNPPPPNPPKERVTFICSKYNVKTNTKLFKDTNLNISYHTKDTSERIIKLRPSTNHKMNTTIVVYNK